MQHPNEHTHIFYHHYYNLENVTRVLKSMKRKVNANLRCKLPLPLFTLLLALSCSNNDVNPLTDIRGSSSVSYNQSLTLWNRLKKQYGNSYTYAVTQTSFTTIIQTTQLQVDDGTVTNRTYEAFMYTGSDGGKKILHAYAENSTNLGTHEGGFPITTFDELYDSCATTYLAVNPDSHSMYFDTTETGIMKLCGSAPKGCIDDCYTGVMITSFEWKK